jgi:hypothetical protein
MTGVMSRPNTDGETAHRAGWIVVVAGLEAAATGLVLVAAPGLFGVLVLGSDLSEAGQALGRLAGIVLLSFGLACWLAIRRSDGCQSILQPMQVYHLLATVYLAYLGLSGMAGVLLWPAVGIHSVLLILLTRKSLVSGRSTVAREH